MKKKLFILIGLCLTIVLSGQRLPGVVSASGQVTAGFSFPAVLSDGNTVAWYIANESSTITKDGSNLVSRWNDYLGSGHDLVQASGTLQPLWSASGILFDGVDNYMKASTFTLNQPEFIYMVLNYKSYIADSYCFDGNAVNSGGMYTGANSPLRMRAIGDSDSPINSDLVAGDVSIVRILFYGASSKFLVDGHAAVTGNFGAANMSGITIGSSAIATVHANVEYIEIIIRKISDSSGDETDIYNYLKNKYGL
jgi:hypothetical protein